MKQLSLEDINLDMIPINVLEWMAAEEKEDKIYAAVMMILAMITRR